jgi:flagellar basal body-associated protein FliL
MKSDSTTVVLNVVLVVLAACGVFCAILTFTRTHELRQLNSDATKDNAVLMRMQNIVGQVEAYNQKYPDPKLAAILQSITKPAPRP